MMTFTRHPLAPIALSMALITFWTPVLAETTSTPEPSKKELVEKVLTLQRGLIEGVADGLVQQPANQLIQQADSALQSRIPPERRSEVIKGVKADIQKFLDEATPMVRSKALQAAPSTLGTLLEEKFSADELKQLIAILESPVNRKLNDMGPEMHQLLTDKIVSDARPEIEPRIRELQSNLAKRFAAPSPTQSPTAESQGSTSKPPGKPSAPAKPSSK